jgi:hypothetical protein
VIAAYNPIRQPNNTLCMASRFAAIPAAYITRPGWQIRKTRQRRHSENEWRKQNNWRIRRPDHHHLRAWRKLGASADTQRGAERRDRSRSADCLLLDTPQKRQRYRP